MVVFSFVVPFTWNQRVAETFQGYLMAMRYYLFSSRRHAVQSSLQKLLATAQQQQKWCQCQCQCKSGGVGGESCYYTKINMVGYSLGSLLALDAVYPFQEAADATTGVVGTQTPPPSVAVDNLITLGCPFNMVQMIFPWYSRNNRRIDEKDGFQWTNIFIPSDALGCKFHHGSSCGEGEGEEEEEVADMDINGNIISKSNKIKTTAPAMIQQQQQQQRMPGTPINIVYRTGWLLGHSSLRWIDEIQITLASLVGYPSYSHLLYVVFSDGLYLVFDDTVADHIVNMLFFSNPTKSCCPKPSSSLSPNPPPPPEPLQSTETTTTDNDEAIWPPTVEASVIVDGIESEATVIVDGMDV